MKSKIFQEILDETPKEVENFVRLYSNLVIRINQILKEKEYTQKQLAEGLGKSPSEIHKWLSGEHNFTLRSIAKLEAELGEELLYIPERKTSTIYIQGQSKTYQTIVYKTIKVIKGIEFSGKWKPHTTTNQRVLDNAG